MDVRSQFKIVKANTLGYYIVHSDTGRFLTADGLTNNPDKCVHLSVCDNFGSVFVFENGGDGTVLYVLYPTLHSLMSVTDFLYV